MPDSGKLPPALYVCGTPIGNLQDSTERVLQTLRMVDLIAAEDTRVTQKLLMRYKIKAPLISLQKYNEEKRVHRILEEIRSGKSVALVSDAGTPNISDPGDFLVRQLTRHGVRVAPIPGPSSLTAFLSVSGLRADRFIFGGFFPKKDAELHALLNATAGAEMTYVFFESGNRILAALERLGKVAVITELCVAKELTKQFETIWHGGYEEVIDAVRQAVLKGEWIFGLKMSCKKGLEKNGVDALISLGLTRTQFTAIATKLLGYSKNEAYKAYLTHD